MQLTERISRCIPTIVGSRQQRILPPVYVIPAQAGIFSHDYWQKR